MAEQQDTKVCPFCAETIKAAATVCRYCGRELGGSTVSAPVASVSPVAGLELAEYERRRQRMDELVQRYLAQGYRITSRTDTAVQLVRPKQFNGLAAFLWFLVAVVGVVVYLLYYASKRDDMVYLDITRPETLGMVPKAETVKAQQVMIKRRMRRIGYLTIAAFALALVGSRFNGWHWLSVVGLIVGVVSLLICLTGWEQLEELKRYLGS